MFCTRMRGGGETQLTICDPLPSLFLLRSLTEQIIASHNCSYTMRYFESKMVLNVCFSLRRLSSLRPTVSPINA